MAPIATAAMRELIAAELAGSTVDSELADALVARFSSAPALGLVLGGLGIAISGVTCGHAAGSATSSSTASPTSTRCCR